MLRLSTLAFCLSLVLGFYTARSFADAAKNPHVSKQDIAPSAVSAAEKLSAVLDPIKTFSASFKQRVVDENGELLEDYQGQMIVQKPGKLYWVSAEPVSQTVVSDGNTIWFYDADLEQVTQQKFTEDFQNTPALLLGGDSEKISNQFNVTLVVGEQIEKVSKTSQALASRRFLLHPTAENAMFDSLELEIVNGQIVSLHMKDSLGQLTSIEFSDVKVNAKVEQQLFTFVPPDGVDIIVDE